MPADPFEVLGGQLTKIPSVYDNPGYEHARELNAEMAENYVAHTVVGDPVADRAIAALADVGECRDGPVGDGVSHNGVCDVVLRHLGVQLAGVLVARVVVDAGYLRQLPTENFERVCGHGPHPDRRVPSRVKRLVRRGRIGEMPTVTLPAGTLRQSELFSATGVAARELVPIRAE